MAGKRRTGPAPKGAYAGKSMVLSTRITPETRAALVGAKTKSGRSLSQEIEHRLRRSFDRDERWIEIFGSRQNYAVLRLIAAAMDTVNPTRSGSSWRDDPFAFDQMIIAVNAVLAALRPPGDPSAERVAEAAGSGGPTDPYTRAKQSYLPLQGALRAEDLLQRIKETDPALPIPRRADPVPFIRDDLGALVDRIPLQGDIAEEAKRRFFKSLFADFPPDNSASDAVRQWASGLPPGPPPPEIMQWLADRMAAKFSTAAPSDRGADKESHDGK